MLQLTMSQQYDLADTLLGILRRIKSLASNKSPYVHTHHEALEFEFWANYSDDGTVDTVTIIGRVYNHDHEGVTIPFDWAEEKQLEDLRYIVRMCVHDADE